MSVVLASLAVHAAESPLPQPRDYADIGGTAVLAAAAGPAPANTMSPDRLDAAQTAVAATDPEAELPVILRRIGGCESVNSPTKKINYKAQNPRSTASGGFQILDSTWKRFMGYLKAKYAPPEVQNKKAMKLYAEQGTAPWIQSKSCWD